MARVIIFLEFQGPFIWVTSSSGWIVQTKSSVNLAFIGSEPLIERKSVGVKLKSVCRDLCWMGQPTRSDIYTTSLASGSIVISPSKSSIAVAATRPVS